MLTSKKTGLICAIIGEVESAIDSREWQQRKNFPGQVMSELAPEGGGRMVLSGWERLPSKGTGQGRRHEVGDPPGA